MAENKMYMTQPNEFGQILISEDVLATIAYQSLVDIDGFAGLTPRSRAEGAKVLGPKNWRRGIYVYINEKGQLFMELNILVHYGANITLIAEKIQKLVASSIYSVTGQRARRIRVNICGIIRN